MLTWKTTMYQTRTKRTEPGGLRDQLLAVLACPATDSQESAASAISRCCAGYMQRWGKLNDRQLAVLRRIGEGVDPVGKANSELANTVYALRGRGLVSTPRRDGVWRAEITEAGSFYLEHGCHPDKPDFVTPSTSTSGAARSSEGRSRTSADPAASGRPGRAPRGDMLASTAERLIKRLREEGGTLHISDPDESTRAQYRSALHVAVQRKLVPEGFHLRHTGRDAGDLIIRLDSDEHPDETDWNRIRLSARDLITNPDELVARLRDDRASIDVSEPVLARALAFVRDLAEEADRRGYMLALSKRGKPRGLRLHVRGQQFALLVKEECDEVPHRYTEEELSRQKRYSWQRIEPEMDSVPSGRLRLELQAAANGEVRNWSDDGRSRIESKVKALIKDARQLADAAEDRRRKWERVHAAEMEEWRRKEEAAKRRDTERRAEWEAAMASARDRAQDDHRAKQIGAALEAWETAGGIREFCEAMENASASASPEMKAAIRRWTEFGRSLADSLDPGITPEILSEASFDTEPTPDDLRPYLGDWSPYRPERERRPDPTTAPARVSYDDIGQSSWRWGRPGRARWWRR
jgi:hypothetical protein